MFLLRSIPGDMDPPHPESKPSPQRLDFLAFRVLEDAAIEARETPIRRTIAHRLALGWLAYAGLSEPWRTELFWRTLGGDDRLDRPGGQYCRDMDFARCLNGWRRRIGLAPKEDWYRLDQPQTVSGGDVQPLSHDQGRR